jgi:hypothetical protein
MHLRGLDPSTTIVRVGTDGGGGSFKVIANIFDPEKKQKKGEFDTGLYAVETFYGNSLTSSCIP